MFLRPSVLLFTAILGACRPAPAVTAPGPAVAPSADSATGRTSTAAPARGDSATRLFYKGARPGTDLAFNPVSVVLNEGFDILQVGSDRHVLQRNYSSGARAVVRSLGAPISTIRAYGTADWLRDEVLPLSSNDGGGAAWFPNYLLHFIGSGMVSARLREWYEAHGVAHPQRWSVLTMYTAHLLNEVNELTGFDGRSEDTITDLLLFDALGQVAFSSSRVQRAFSNRHFRLGSWPLQPVLTLPGQTLENVGQYFVFKWQPVTDSRWGVLYTTGMNGVLGVSYLRTDGVTVSMAAGSRSDSLVVVNPTTNAKIARLQRDAALYVDRDNSLLLSVRYQHREEADLSINLYPGVLRIGAWSPGLWAQHRLAGGLQFGIAGRWTPGIGVSAGPQ
jgi:hypothetical protein